MVRAAAKNHPSVAVVTDPLGYDGVLAAVRNGGFTLAERKKLASLAFRHTAEYDIAVAGWMESTLAPEQPAAAFPRVGRPQLAPLDPAALRREPASAGRALRRPRRLAGPGAGRAAARKRDVLQQLHRRGRGLAGGLRPRADLRGDHQARQPVWHRRSRRISVADAHRKAHECDPLSAFGGVIAANTEVSVEMAEYVSTIFTEVIIAPAYAPGALDVLTRKKNIRVLVASEPLDGGTELRPISGGLLMQQRDQTRRARRQPAQLDAGRPDPPADPATLADLVFAWRTCRAVKSNAIVIAADGATIGVGMGQVNRVDAARLAVERGGDRVSGAVAASDAFFPFPDGLETLTAAGVKAIVHPGGSVRDDEVTAAAAKAGVTLYLTGARHFAH